MVLQKASFINQPIEPGINVYFIHFYVMREDTNTGDKTATTKTKTNGSPASNKPGLCEVVQFAVSNNQFIRNFESSAHREGFLKMPDLATSIVGDVSSFTMTTMWNKASFRFHKKQQYMNSTNWQQEMHPACPHLAVNKEQYDIWVLQGTASPYFS
ncbi:hypothetical protein ACFSKU_21450 [Pontibacter silvestris]|uniref:Uncharacterized protein n=1 Tax=Pontibacter silvestris TaxID=2305183 RepID=A0ABW4X5T3_9BACT|nr:hypothetical protein [Pontibacter silvestris]MCC9137879.1 hypothetical protein [Pontibacter silvestris]